ncbi:MAG: hopanoid biosynthesis-associated protein HpnK [Steroidobacteraceae bacterium]
MSAVGRRFLIVTADDFGLHEAVNDAVERAAAAGILTAASLMVGEAAAGDAVRRARALPGLRVGLHLVLADGRASLAARSIPALVDGEGRMDSRMFARALRFFASPTVRRQLQAEIRAQFAAFARTGLRLDHVNAHKHFHLHPTLLTMLLEIGAEYGLKAVRVPAEPLWFARRCGGWPAGAAAALLRPWIALMKRRLRAAGMLYNDQLFGVAASGAMDEAKIMEVAARLPPGVTEVYLHPASVSGGRIAPGMHDYRHTDELAALLSPRVLAALDTAGIRRGGFADVPQ